MKGILLAGGTGSRLWPATKGISKQLIPVYDKPMIYYPLTTLMLAGATEIAIITSPSEQSIFKKLLGDGSAWGLQFSFLIQEAPLGLAHSYLVAEDFLAGQSSCMVLGDNLFHSPGLQGALKRAASITGASVFAYQVNNPEDYGVIEFDESGIATSLEEKPSTPKSNFAIPGVYFMDGSASEKARAVRPSARGELEITELLSQYLDSGELTVEKMPRGSVWLDTGTFDSMAEATEYVKVVQKRQGLIIGSPEEVAWRLGLIDESEFRVLAQSLLKSGYGSKLLKLIEGQA